MKESTASGESNSSRTVFLSVNHHTHMSLSTFTMGVAAGGGGGVVLGDLEGSVVVSASISPVAFSRTSLSLVLSNEAGPVPFSFGALGSFGS